MMINTKLIYQSDIINNKNIYDELINKINKYTIPNLIILGLKFSGKTTLCNFLMNLYSNNSIKQYNIQLDNYLLKKDIYISINTNDIYYEYISQGLSIDIYAIQKLIKMFILNKSIVYNKFKFKFIIIKNAEKLSNTTQQSLRCIIERYYKICRFIFITKDITNFINPIISRCNIYRLKNPNKNDLLLKSLQHIKNQTDVICILQNINKINNYNDLYWFIYFLNNKCIDKYYDTKIYENIIIKLIDLIDNNFITNFKNNIITMRKYIYTLYILSIKYDTIIDYITYIFINKYKNNRIILQKILNILCKYSMNFIESTKYMIIFENIFCEIINILI